MSAGKAAIDGLPCEKPDKPVPEGGKISVRGLGKIKLAAINGPDKKGQNFGGHPPVCVRFYNI